ncbi:helix-turn-helix domain-containing protein [Hydrogenophaga sp.]|uniref:helix-turn-helix domain-containing protein n=2 Tax=Hydrogenophaga sp. TaxID=1904254 RepID=UPI00271C4BBD|nr:helix-turn-helix domain-containing protein [Hydrogenophaga sp.]MDO9133786.1 helix-turn-helix domain-containing protein [Hydrogenophaga sp.]
MRVEDNPIMSRLFLRDDMGAMLDLKLETVSRTLSAFEREGLIEPLDKLGRVYRVVDAERLSVPKS